MIGEIAPVALTTPLILGLFGGGWALALLLWAVPVGLTALVVLRGTPRDAIDRRAGGRTGVSGRRGDLG